MRLCVVILMLVLGGIGSLPSLAQERIALPLEQLIVERQLTPNSPTQVILRKTQIEVDAQFFAQTRAYVAILINSDEAVRDYSQMSLSFNSFYETVALDFASVRTPDGKMHKMLLDAVQIQNPAEENFYQDTKELMFSLPNVQVGSIIEFQYHRRDIKKIMPGAWFDGFWFNWWEERAANQGPRLDPVGEAVVEIRAPAALPLFSQATSALKAEFSKKVTGDIQTLSWRQKNVPGVVLQNNMPRDTEFFPMIQLSSLNSWQSVARWGVDLFAPHMDTNDRLQKLVASLKGSAHNPQEAVQQVYQFLQKNIRYVFAHVGRGGYEPHSATEVLINGYGDCKDQSLLAVTLLRQLGVEAYPALVATRARGLPKLNAVAVAFDHMITYIPAQPGVAETWLDTASEISLFPGFSTGIEGQPALIIKPETQQLMVIQSRSPEAHLAHLELKFDRVSSQAVEAHFNIVLGGMFEESLRSGWLFAPEKQKALSDMLANLYAAGELTELHTRNADNLWLPFSVSGRFVFKNAWPGEHKPLNYGFNLDQVLAVFSDVMHLHKPDERKQDYVNDPGYKITTDITFMSPPGDYEIAVTSRGGNYANPWFMVTQQGAVEGSHYRVQQSFLMKSQAVPVDAYRKFFAAIKSVIDAPAWQVVYMPLVNKVAVDNTKENVSAGQVLINQARQLLDQGDFAQALVTAEKAVSALPKNGEAFYVLGLAQGYQEQIDSANKSFGRAKELGFTP